MSETASTHTYFSIVPRSDTSRPSYWWSGLRYMQAYRTICLMDPIVQRLQARIREQSWPWVRGIPDTPHSGALTWEVPHAEIVTAEDKREASFVASQTLHYLRSALDHLVYNASWLTQGQPKKGTQFPICTSEADWNSGRVRRNLGGMSATHAEWVRLTQPFNGTQWTEFLRDLSNADKHRFGIEVSPTVQLKVNTGGSIFDPRSTGVRLAQIEQVSLHLLLPALDPYGEFPDVFNNMMVGVAELLNLFLDEAGIEKIEIGPPRVITADGATG